MDRRQLALQMNQAFEDIKAATITIGEKLGIDEPDFAVPTVGGPEVVSLRRWQVMAEYLQTVVEVMPTQRKRREVKAEITPTEETAQNEEEVA